VLDGIVKGGCEVARVPQAVSDPDALNEPEVLGLHALHNRGHSSPLQHVNDVADRAGTRGVEPT
jgi:hypothetical protein